CRAPRKLRTVKGMKRSERIAGRVVPVVWTAVWLWPLMSPVAAIASGHVHPVVPAVAGLAALMVLYVAVVIQAFGGKPHPPTPAPLGQLALLALLGAGLALGYGGGPSGWLSTLLYVGAAGSAMLRGPGAFGWAIGSVAALSTIGLVRHLDGSEIGANAFNVL